MEQLKGIKRKHFELVKSDLAVELTKLTNDSDKLNKDLRGAKADFELMCKSMTDRQADFLTHGLFLEEQYGKVIGVLDGKIHPGERSSAGEDEARRTGSVVDIRKFARDSRESLINHRISREIALQEMETTF
ncbi:hypothetical protein DCAR_0830866 [Daucus carota subsp. sativus]|uniref:Uncharacterized protein n=1 Tax=Daucus carota subsp. sativus TaxID=79200 RepID=A0A175YMS8_DAUCS|nr:PREDICTED: uncharacterized protein LOC108198956 [Daucus carota subsp. sativus]WOH11383.1 hypothetical protein DCAR_0830866 [Daucus carota subsp. sativus]